MRPNSSIIKQCSNSTQDIKTLRHLLTVCNSATLEQTLAVHNITRVKNS